MAFKVHGILFRLKGLELGDVVAGDETLFVCLDVLGLPPILVAPVKSVSGVTRSMPTDTREKVRIHILIDNAQAIPLLDTKINLHARRVII